MSTEPRTPWQDLQDIAESIGYECRFELGEVQHPPKICAPTPHDWDWPMTTTPMPEDMDEALVCRVHPEQWWPCTTFRDHGGITPQAATVENVFTFRPVNEA